MIFFNEKYQVTSLKFHFIRKLVQTLVQKPVATRSLFLGGEMPDFVVEYKHLDINRWRQGLSSPSLSYRRCRLFAIRSFALSTFVQTAMAKASQ